MEERVHTFRNEYKGVNLGLADNGKFLPELNRLETEARKAFKTAKESEIKDVVSFRMIEPAHASFS